MNPFVLWVLGLFLIFLEFFLPGAIMGVAGGLLILTSIILYTTADHSPWAIAAYLCLMVASIALVIRFAIWRIRATKSDYSIYSDKDQEGYVASHFDSTAIGKKGIVLSDLKPGGYILIEGKQHQAISQAGYLVKGTEVVVIGGQEESLIVKPIK